jgi:hypothetical protein
LLVSIGEVVFCGRAQKDGIVFMLQVFFQDKLDRLVRVKVEINIDAAADGMVCRKISKTSACRPTSNRF